MTDIYDFYSKNLEDLDSKWKDLCFKNTSLREAGDMYYSEKLFWNFVELKYSEIRHAK
jgi:hypothetical protein